MTVSETATYTHDLREGWKCFHCGERFFTPANAALHFGAIPTAEPGCMLKVARKGEERGLLYALRFAEQERDEALVRMTALRLGLDKELEDESVERYRATRGILFQAGDKSTPPPAALTAALSDQAGGWQDISTAPKDGTSFLTTMAGGVDGPFYVLFWNDRFFESVDSGECPSMAHITHWQPLPAPPPSSTAGEGQ